jgi:multidrug efflux pump subunit AcrB
MNRTLAWFASNPVVANLLMIVILGGGMITAPSITKEIFPEFTLDMISISVRYLGAAPEEVEEGVVVRIEEAIQDLEGIKKITSTASEGLGTVIVEVEPGSDVRKLMDDIKTRVDGIDTFPEETEKPVITELTNRRQVIDVAVYGDVSEKTLKIIGQRVRDDLAAMPGITQVQLVAAKPYEVSIEVSEESLRRYGLTFDEVARAVRASSLDLPGGSIRTRGGEILLRTKGQAYRGRDFEKLVLRTMPDGTRLLLGDVARVVDGFAETDQAARFAGKPAVGIRVFRVGDQNAIEIANKVKEYVSEARTWMPEGVQIEAWNDFSRILRGRLDLMLRNARNGFILVFIILALFLRLRLAFWVSLGIPVSFLGALWLMPVFGVSINLVSLFAFIVVLGIVVDDAIVIGENIFKHHERGETGPLASARGTAEVAVPVVFGVLTTVAAFFPLLFVPGIMGKVMHVIPLIVISVLLFSITEALFILPAHLSHIKESTDPSRVERAWRRFQDRFAGLVDRFVFEVYKPSLDLALRYRYATVAGAVALLLVTAGLVGGGYIKFLFFHRVESDFVSASLTMTPGTSIDETRAAMEELESSALRLRDELAKSTPEGEPNPVKHIFTAIGDQPLTARRDMHGATKNFAMSNVGELIIELTPSEQRRISSAEVVNRWRKMAPPIPDAEELKFASSIFSTGEAVNVQLAGLDLAELKSAADEVKKALANYEGVFDITDSFRRGKREVKLSLKPAAETYGITLAELARQVRQAFYGEEAQRIQRGRDDIRVMVRYPEKDRKSLASLENMRIRTSGGLEVPFPLVASARIGRGYSEIKRVDRKRVINVTADVDPSTGNADEILADLKTKVLPGIMSRYPGISYSFEGERREQAETMKGLIRGFLIALLVIFAMMAIPFKSYIQPLIVMSVIPFGFVGAVWGHLLMGFNLSIISLFGFVALTGVVVNDSIVLVHYVNRRRSEGVRFLQAVRDAGLYRFRPIILTSLTTFAGLTPLLLERSIQARFLIPMAVSLAFGVLFATFITLILVPALYIILEDIKGIVTRSLGLQRSPQAALPEAGGRE